MPLFQGQVHVALAKLLTKYNSEETGKITSITTTGQCCTGNETFNAPDA